jgi:hypothetical protein
MRHPWTFLYSLERHAAQGVGERRTRLIVKAHRRWFRR